MNFRYLPAILFTVLFVQCKSGQKDSVPTPENRVVTEHPTVDLASEKRNPTKPMKAVSAMPGTPDSTFVDLKNYSRDFVYDLKYATADNFLKQAVYDCPECFLRLRTVKALMNANAEFMTMGYRIKLFDCYRPLDIQKRMWKIIPNANYVADPAKGSIHNRGGAVDLTLVDRDGNELDMGTKFDHFGPEAAISYTKISPAAKENRALLQQIMAKHQFRVLPSEWWHFNLDNAAKEPLSNFKWDCD